MATCSLDARTRLFLLIERIAVQIEQRPTLILFLLSALFLVGESSFAAWKPLWFDELLTYYVADLPSIQQVRAALSDGADGHPPLFYLLTRVSLGLFDSTEVAVRAPSLIAMWLYVVLLFSWIRNRMGTLWASVGALLILTSGVAVYATEARPYTFLLLSGMASFFAWTRTTAEHRLPALCVLAASLAVGIWSHYYAVLLFLPLCVGEIVRWCQRRRIDFPVLAAMSMGALPLVALLPQILAYRNFSGGFWAPSRFDSLLTAYPELFGASMPLVLLLGVCSAVLTQRKSDDGNSSPIAAHEIAALVAYLALPIVGYLLARAMTNAYLPRYFIAATTGGVILLCAGLSRVPKFQPIVGLGLAAILGVIFLRLEVNRVRKSRFPNDVVAPAILHLDDPTYQEIPLLVQNPMSYLQYHHYFPERSKRHLYTIAEPERAAERGNDTLERTLVALGRHVPLQVMALDGFLDRFPKFLLLGGPIWALTPLLEKPVEIKLIGWVGDEGLYWVTSTNNEDRSKGNSVSR